MQRDHSPIATIDNILIREADGYVNATRMCKAAGKKLNDYTRSAQAKAFFDALASNTGYPVLELVQGRPGGSPLSRGTWVHPKVAIHLAQWLSADFAVTVSGVIFDWMGGKGTITPQPTAPALTAPDAPRDPRTIRTLELFSLIHDYEKTAKILPMAKDAATAARIAAQNEIITRPDLSPDMMLMAVTRHLSRENMERIQDGLNTVAPDLFRPSMTARSRAMEGNAA